MTTILEASESWLYVVQWARARKTYESYKCARDFFFKHTLAAKQINPSESDVSTLDAHSIAWLAADLKELSPYTEKLYITAVRGFFSYLVAESLSNINLVTVKELVKQRARRIGKRYPHFDSNAIEEVMAGVEAMPISKDPQQRLRDLRDRALILTLPATGLRISEALSLLRGTIHWENRLAVIIGKGDKEGIIRFSKQSIAAMQEYLKARQAIDGASGMPLGSIPIFVRHDRGASKRMRPLTTESARVIVRKRVTQTLGAGTDAHITPHDFRHAFVDLVMKNSRTHNPLKLAQRLARHESIEVTQQYAHLDDRELDDGYYEVFETRR